MAKSTLETAFKRLVITPEVCVMLGKTESQIRRMDMKKFSEAIFDRGYDFTINAREASAGHEGKLTIMADNQGPPTDTGSVT